MIKILIADDHAIVRSGLVLLLQMQPDMQVVGEAADGAQAYDQALALKPDVVLMDIAMSKENGLFATKRLKQKLPDIHVLILTMYQDKDLLFNALHAGASGYALKRAHQSDLIEAIRTVARGEIYLPDYATEQLLQEYFQQTKDGKSSTMTSKLSQREQEVVALTAQGLTNKQIGKSLHLSVKTIEAHKSRIMEKLNLQTRHKLVRYAYVNGLLHFE